MKISAVFASYNVARELPILFDSLLASTVQVDEVCICDDCSQDDTLEVIASYSDRLNIRVEQNPVNRGVTRTRTAAFNLATGTHILMLDPDVRLYEDTIERLVALMKERNADVVTGGYTDVALDDDRWSRFYALWAHHTFQVAEKPFEYNVFNAWLALCRREVIETVGGFGDIDQGVEIENELMGRKVVGAGFRLLLDPSNCVDHHWGGYEKLRYIYTQRVYWWVKTYFADGLEFEDAMTTSSYGFASLALPAGVATLPLAALPWGAVVPASLIAGFLAGYSPFFRFAAERRGVPYAAACVLTSGYFSFFVAKSAVRSALEEVGRKALRGDFTLSEIYGT